MLGLNAGTLKAPRVIAATLGFYANTKIVCQTADSEEAVVSYFSVVADVDVCAWLPYWEMA